MSFFVPASTPATASSCPSEKDEQSKTEEKDEQSKTEEKDGQSRTEEKDGQIRTEEKVEDDPVDTCPDEPKGDCTTANTVTDV